MSVKISRREEKRNTSLRDFILAAIFPLLLTGLIGFLIGKAGGIDAGASSNELLVMKERAMTAEKEAAELKSFILRVDSLRTSLTKAVNKHGDILPGVIAASNDDVLSMSNPLSKWLGEASAIKNVHADEIHQLKAGLKETDPRLQDAITALFENLNSSYYNNFNRQKNHVEGRTDSAESCAEKLSDREEEFQEEIDDYKGKIKSFERKVENKELEISNLQLQLSQGGTPVLTPKSFASEKGIISNATIKIENITAQIPTGVLVSRKRKEDIEGKIKEQLGLIRNALMIID